MRLSIRQLVPLLGTCALALAFAAVPASAESETFKDSFTVPLEGTEVDFCGTGATLEYSGESSHLIRGNPSGFTDGVTMTVLWTNPLNGKTVTEIQRYQYRERFISGDPDGVHTSEQSWTGLEHQLRTDHGTVLFDAGSRVVRTTFNEEGPTGQESIFRGPHPVEESDYEAFCAAMVDALDLPQPPQ